MSTSNRTSYLFVAQWISWNFLAIPEVPCPQGSLTGLYLFVWNWQEGRTMWLEIEATNCTCHATQLHVSHPILVIKGALVVQSANILLLSGWDDFKWVNRSRKLRSSRAFPTACLLPELCGLDSVASLWPPLTCWVYTMHILLILCTQELQ